jgi:hypothetical protein
MKPVFHSIGLTRHEKSRTNLTTLSSSVPTYLSTPSRRTSHTFQPLAQIKPPTRVIHDATMLFDELAAACEKSSKTVVVIRVCGAGMGPQGSIARGQVWVEPRCAHQLQGAPTKEANLPCRDASRMLCQEVF